MFELGPGDPLWRDPITGIAGCYARAASGEAAATPAVRQNLDKVFPRPLIGVAADDPGAPIAFPQCAFRFLKDVTHQLLSAESRAFVLP
jgi:hypothetical protein